MMRELTPASENVCNNLKVSTRRQRLMAVKSMVVYLGRVRDAERRCMDASPRPAASSPQRYEAELIASVIDEAICVLEALQ
jgi:hypothetical protein